MSNFIPYNGKYKCKNCGKIVEPFGQIGHYRIHKNSREQKRLFEK